MTNYSKKRYHEIFTRTADQSVSDELGETKPVRGHADERKQLIEAYECIRNYTYTLIGIQNAFRRIVRDYSALDGSNWRSNRGPMTNSEAQELFKQLYKTNPDDTTEILRIETELLRIIEGLSMRGEK